MKGAGSAPFMVQQSAETVYLFMLPLEKLTDEASQTMERAFAVHGEIEKIYSQCIDFGVTDSITKALAIRIFGS